MLLERFMPCNPLREQLREQPEPEQGVVVSTCAGLQSRPFKLSFRHSER
jgi:hypothetical protein